LFYYKHKLMPFILPLAIFEKWYIMCFEFQQRRVCPVNIEMSEKEFRFLLDLVYVGNWVLNTPRYDDRITEYDAVHQKLLSKCPEVGMRALVRNIAGGYFPSQAYVDGGIHEAIADYEDSVFFNILAEELARRDLGLEDSDPEDFTQLTERMEDYLSEFDKNGLESVHIDI